MHYLKPCGGRWRAAALLLAAAAASCGALNNMKSRGPGTEKGETAGGASSTPSPTGSNSPSPREYPALAYDATRRKLILFGGYFHATRTVFGDTWEWDGSVWRLLTTEGPAARDDHVMTCDAARGRVVLFGGWNNGTIFRDTWEWDGAAWKKMADGGPPGGDVPAMTYDSRRQRVVLFGGYYEVGGKGLRSGETWEWDGASWRKVATSGPTPRASHAMAYDAARGRVVLFGGSDGENSLGDTWLWDGTRWEKSAAKGPAPRSNHSMAYDTARARVILFGGSGAGADAPFGDTWEWDGNVWRKVADTGPPARVGNNIMAEDESRARLVLFGGRSGAQRFGDTWEWDGRRWTEVGAR